jgi:acetylornithine deacetylase
MYAAQCQAHIERRTVPGETEAHVLSEINAIILRLTKSDPTFQATVKSLLVRDAMEIFPGSPIVKALTDAAEDILPKPPLYTGRPFWMDAALIAAAGIPTVVIGPTGTGAHAKEEWVTIDSTATLALILAQTAVTFTHT